MRATRAPGDWPKWLRRKIVALLVFKLLAILALWWFFFGPDNRHAVDDETIMKQMQNAQPVSRVGTDAPIAGDQNHV